MALAIAVIVSYLLITSTQITAGEMVPKLYAIDRAETVARRIARPLQAFRILFHPFIVSLTVVSNAMLGMLGVDPQRRISRGGSPDELKRLIRDSEAGGMLETNEATMLSGVFHLHEQEARQVMTPIPAVVTVDLAEDVQTALRRCIDSGHTRLLVTEDENQDRIRGVVHATGLARRLLEVGPAASIPLVRDAPIVPESKPLDDLLAELQRQRTAMAVVADEYGRVMGIVTIEDIVEEVVGEIIDETDPAAGDIRQLPDGDWFVRGHVPVADLADYGIELPADSDAYNSIGGLVFNDLGRLAKRGDKIDVDGYELRVESVRENRIVLVRIRQRAGAVARGRRGRRGRGGLKRGPRSSAGTPVKHPTPRGVTGRRELLGGGVVARVCVALGSISGGAQATLKVALRVSEFRGEALSAGWLRRR